MEIEVKVKKYTCTKCNYSWISRITTKPKQCPNCKSTNWATSRKDNKKRKILKNE